MNIIKEGSPGGGTAGDLNGSARRFGFVPWEMVSLDFGRIWASQVPASGLSSPDFLKIGILHIPEIQTNY